MTATALIDEFENRIQGMVGKLCWSVQVSGVGSLANLHIGEKIPRTQPMLHKDFNLEMDERAYVGEYVLYLEECPWRLDGPEGVIASWMDSSDQGGRIRSGLPQLTNRQVQRTQLRQPGLDLELDFAGGYTLRVFPDQVDPDEGDNYSIAIGDTTYVVAANSILYVD